MRPKLLTVRQAARLINVSDRTFHTLRGEPWFPAAIELGPRALRWHEDELLQTLAERAPRRTVQSEPTQLLRARVERLKGAER